MADLEFLDELPEGARAFADRPDYWGIAEQLRENPNEWAIVATDPYTALVSQIEKAGIKAFRPAGHYKAVQLGATYKGETPTGKEAHRAPRVAAMYVGPQVDAESPTRYVSRAIAKHYVADRGLTWSHVKGADREVLIAAAEAAYLQVFPLIADELARA